MRRTSWCIRPDLFKQGQQIAFRTLHLIECALPRSLIGAPSQQRRSVSKSFIRKMIVANFDDELWLQRLPLARPLGRPSAWSARRSAGEAGRSDQRFELFSELCFGISLDRRCKANVMK